ncbi:HipA domain-containing protein [Shewanella algicola]|uniref:HipA domain-containing protein n=1 Tax=Shewanella algicola TaxID=640633 RepID=UPI0024949861|nr:HipA domain-containing protein [Shewanella algicola]
MQEARKLVKRALFNFITVNQDDHAKNFAFLADDDDQWQLSPFYDILYSPSPYKEHMTSFNGNGSSPKLVLNILAGHADYSSDKPLREMLEEIYQQTRSFAQEAKNLGIPKQLLTIIDNHMIEK